MRLPNEEGKLGKYDELCEACLRASNADGTVLIVLGGEHGSGFSVSSVSEEMILDLPGLLREVADSIEAQMKATKTN